MEKGKYVLIDRSGHGEHVVIQSGWSEKSKEMMRFTTSNGTFVCRKKDLLTILFYIGDDEERQSLVTKNLRSVVYGPREVKFKAQQNYNKGDDVYVMVNVPVKMTEQKSQPLAKSLINS